MSSVCSAAAGLRCTATASGEFTCPGPTMLQPGTLSLGGPHCSLVKALGRVQKPQGITSILVVPGPNYAAWGQRLG